MFEIGNSLREARLRQGIELPRLESDTKIRAKYLTALEEERFEALPGETYVKGFLRTYAEYLGLDGQLYVDEFNSRFATAEEQVLAPSARRPRPRAIESNFVVVALAGIVAVTILVVIAWRVGSSGGDSASTLLIETQPAAPTQTAPVAPASTPPAQPAGKRALAKLVLSATGGDCWLQVRAGSATGELLYEGTVQQGQTQRFVKWRRLWIQLGAPSNLAAKLNGHRVDLPDRQAIVVVTAKAVRTVSTV